MLKYGAQYYVYIEHHLMVNMVTDIDYWVHNHCWRPGYHFPNGIDIIIHQLQRYPLQEQKQDVHGITLNGRTR